MTNNFPQVQFVTAPRVGARVLMDLNHADHDLQLRTGPTVGWDLGSPSLTGPADATGRTWGDRTVTFPLALRGPRAATKMLVARLARILLRRRTYLLWRLDDSSKPVWFEVWASEPGGLNFDRVYNDPALRADWEATLRLTCSPWALGERVTHDLGSLGNDPTSGGSRVVLPPILGDAPTPLTVTATPAADWGLRRVVTAAWSTEPDEAQDLYVKAAGQFAAAPSTSGVTSDPAWAGGGYRSVTSSHGTMTTRMTIADSAPGLRPGRYRAFVLCGPSGADAAHDVQVQITSGSYGVTGPATRVVGPARPGFRSWVPAGTFSLPVGVEEAALDETDLLPQMQIAISTRRVSGSDTIQLGALMLVPVGGPSIEASTLLTARYLAYDMAPVARVEVDGAAEAIVGYRAPAGTTQSVGPNECRGSFPIVVPGLTNTVAIIQQAAEVVDQPGLDKDNEDDARQATGVTVSYRPLHLWLPSNETEAKA